MLFDFSDSTVLKKDIYDFCICGSGPAGVTLALRLSAAGKRVALLEGGGLDYSQQSQDIYKTKDSGTLKGYPSHTRLRFFGGSTNHWAGRCRPFDKSDFTRKSFGELPGWPISFEEFDEYMPQALDILDIDKSFYTSNQDLGDGNFYADFFALSPPTRIKEKYLDRVSKNKNIDLFINCNLIDIQLSEEKDSVSEFIVSNYSLERSVVNAVSFVLCMGGMENPRILLNSNSQISEGIGNTSGLVGRCFMEHFNVTFGEFVFKDEPTAEKIEYYSSEELVANKNIGKGNLALSTLRRLKEHGRLDFVRNFFKVLACNAGVEEKVQFIASFKCPGSGLIQSLIEQFPDRNSYLSKGSEKDIFGLSKFELNWNMSDEDKQTIRILGRELAKGFVKTGIGRVKLEDYILDDSLELPSGHHAHHMGTTRMAESDEFGVVDPNCRVFGVDNLYVAGSSVFPSGGGGNPTMPLLQLTLRLSDHLLDVYS